MDETMNPQDQQRAIDTLDRCLARIRRGLPIARAGVDAPEQAGDLQPLLALAQALGRAGDQPIPAPPRDLRPGRAAFLAAAAALAAEGGEAQGAGEADRLDAALALRGAGRSIDEALVHLNGDRHTLRPLVQLADQLVAAAPAPPPPTGLRSGRRALLAAAARLAVAESDAAPRTSPAGDAAAISALDRSLARQAQGLDPLAELDAQQRQSIGPLVGLAAGLPRLAQAAPPPPAGLVPGRERLLAAAQALAAGPVAAEQAPASGLVPSPKGTRAEVIGARSGAHRWGWWPSLGSRGLRLAASALAALSLFLGGTRALNTAAAQALPGDLLYPVKRANEGLDLFLVAFDAGELQRLRGLYAQRRAVEIERLGDSGREASLWLTATLVDLRQETDGRWTLQLVVPAAGQPERPLTVVLEAGAEGPLNPQTLAPGQSLRLKLRSGDPDGLARVLALSILGDGPVAPPVEAPTATALPGATRLAPDRASATPARRATSGPSPVPSLRVLATATLALPSPAPSPTLGPDAGAQPQSLPTADRGQSRVDGTLIAMPEPQKRWLLREFNGADQVELDLSQLAPADLAGYSVGDALRVFYRRGTQPRQVLRLQLLRAQACPQQTAVGTVRSFDGTLLLLDDGRSFRVAPGIAAARGLAPGAEVRILFRDCGEGAVAESIELTASRRFVGTGHVAQLSPNGDGASFRLVMDEGEQAVEADGATRVSGRGLDSLGQLAEGMLVRVVGQVGPEGRLRAERIEVLALPEAGVTDEPPSPTAPPSATPQAPTPAPSPSPTAQPTSQVELLPPPGQATAPMPPPPSALAP